ncbi:MAG: hypothetical protein ABR968_05095 [Bacteroidales bacterium]|jgi:hypothetical protein
MKRFLFPAVLFFFSCCQFSFAQVSVKDSAISMSLISFSYGYQKPGADMAKRFFSNSNVGGSFFYKTKSNWLFGADGYYMFRDTIKEGDIFKSIETSDGNVIDGNGIYADIYLQERGFNISGRVGKLFPLWGPNKNSGFVIMVGPGFLLHKIRIENPDHTAPQIQGDYAKGYDRLTDGISANEFIGYMYIGNKRLVTFFAGFDFVQAWTKGCRGYNFDLHGPDNAKRFDMLSGIKVGWIIPIYKIAPDKYYYY